MTAAHRRVRLACYASNVCMSLVANLSPLLFLTFRAQYGISFTMLGLLIVINYFSQLIIDLIFSFFSHKFNIAKTVKLMPWLTIAGYAVFAGGPALFPQHAYAALMAGTVLFSISAGLCEVLLSPVIAALPADDPDREMSKLHSIYAWGTVFVVIFSTLFLMVFGTQNWQWLALVMLAVPLTAALLFAGAEIPQMSSPEKISGVMTFLRNKGLWLCVLAIFLGGAAECTMSQWSSSYIEQAIGLPKVWGDVGGVALFAVMLGTGRTLYAKRGKDISKVLLLGGIGAACCYLVAAVSDIPLIGLAACALTGLCTSMLWPGSLIVATTRFPAGGVLIYALMAAGGDLGASIGPQLVGMVTDAVISSAGGTALAAQWGLTADQLGMKLGMLVGMVFPLVSIPVYALIRKKESRHECK